MLTTSYSTGITTTTEKYWDSSWTSTVIIFLTLIQTRIRHTYLNTKPQPLIISFLSVFHT